MDEKNHISDAKLMLFIVIGTLGVTAILMADVVHGMIHKGLEQMKSMWF